MLPLGAMPTDVPSVLLVVSCVGFPLCVMSRFRYAVRHCVEKLPLVEDRTGLWYQLEMGDLDAFFKRLNRTGVASSWTLPNRPSGSASRYRPDLREPLVERGALTAVITLGLLLGIGCFMAGVSRDFAHGVAQAQLVLISACIILLAGTAFADDKERNTLETLLSTPISRRALVMGRFLRVVRRVTVYALAPQVLLLLGLPSALAAIGSDDIWYYVWPLGLLGLALFLGMAIVIGLVCSGLCRSRESALGSTFLALAVWYLGPYGLYALVHAFGGSEPALGTLLFLSPLGWLHAVFEPSQALWGRLLGILGVVGLAGSALMAWLIRRFDAIMVKA